MRLNEAKRELETAEEELETAEEELETAEEKLKAAQMILVVCENKVKSKKKSIIVKKKIYHV
jgi:multidrug resistance efflux pump